jgi:hypothetical protein
LLLAIGLPSYRSARGGEGYEVYLNQKLIMQKFGKELAQPALLKLDPSQDQQLRIIYYHCGKNGKNRQLTLRDESEQVLKVWKYANSSQPASPMELNLAAVAQTGKSKGSGKWSLHYNSSELQNERQLLVIEKSAAIARR